MNPEKLAKLQGKVRIGGKGSARRKVKKVHKVVVEDKKLQAQLKRLNAQQIPNVEEVNMFREDGTVIHFKQPKVQASIQCNTFCITGIAQNKTVLELSPGIITQLGAESLAGLQKLAETYNFDEIKAVAEGKMDAVPDLVDFEKVSEE